MAKIISTSTSLLVLAGPSYTLSLKDLSSYKRARIYTHDCRANVEFIKANELHLHTASFSYPHNFTISTVGEDGISAVKDTKAIAAKNASSLWLSSAHLQPTYPFIVKANGGNGFGGEDNIATAGQGGMGGKGGNGADVELLYNDAYRTLLRESHEVNALKAPEERREKMKSWLKLVQASFPTSTELLEPVTHLLKMLDDVGGSLEATVETWRSILDWLEGKSDLFHASIAVTCAGGHGGMGGAGSTRGLTGESGQSGKLRSDILTSKTIRASQELFLHPDQVAMMVTAIENQYFVGTLESLRDVLEYTRVLKSRLEFLDVLEPNDALFTSYRDHEQDLLIIPSGTGEPVSIRMLKDSYKHLLAIECRIHSGFDFYNNVSSWVPSASFSYYKTQLSDVLTSFNLVEQNYHDYQSAAKDVARAKDRIACGQAAVEAGKRQCTADLKTVKLELSSAGYTIALLQTKLPAKRTALVKEINKLATEIKDAFHISFETFVNAASQFAFAPGLPMGAIQAASLINTGLNTVTDDSGMQVQKEYVVSQIVSMSSGLEGLQQAIQANVGGELKVDDPSTTKLLAKDADINDLIGKYRGLLGENAVKSIRDMFDDYIKTVLNRNNLIMHYNACLVMLLTTNAKMASYNQTASTLGRDQVENVDYEIPQIAVAVERSYMDTTAKVLELLYRTSKALTYETLSPGSASFAALRNQGFLQKGLGAALEQERVQIIKDWTQAMEDAKTLRQPFGGTDDPVKYMLNDDQLDALMLPPGNGDYAIVIGIPEVYPDTSADDSPFSGYADVRLTRVRFYLEGAKTRTGKIQINLQHAGADDIVDPSGLKASFTHQQLSFKFHYDLAMGTIITDGNVKDVDNFYALPGPFTSWRIAVSQVSNPGLDLSNVKSAWFEFSGLSRAFE